ncbi:MAG: cysteine dioxygenase family protein [Chloroflexi bacterium]|nr:cysteine dioxygenase family protein [Chloroflexota bacterium]
MTHFVGQRVPFGRAPAYGYTIDDFAADVRALLAGDGNNPQTATRIKPLMRRLLLNPALLTPEQSAPATGRYAQHVLFADRDLDVALLALVWLPGQATPIHDHRGWCMVGVYRGVEREIRYVRVDPGRDPDRATLETVGETFAYPGDVALLLPDDGDIHHVEPAPGSELTISLHLYGIDVTRTARKSSIRRVYDLATGTIQTFD